MIIAIDPGEKHVGVCHDLTGEVRTDQLRPRIACEWLTAQLRAYELNPDLEIVIEEYVLYPGQDKRTTWRKMRTSELIGAMKIICMQLGRKPIEQGASIKKPTRRQLRARGIKQVGRGPHERDAELHYYYRKLRRDG